VSNQGLIRSRIGWHRYRNWLSWCLIGSVVAIFSFEKIASAQAPVWTPTTEQTNPEAFQLEPAESSSGETLTPAELKQTLDSLELIEILGFSGSNVDQIGSLKAELRQLPKEQSPPYQLSSSQTQQLRTIFSSLGEPELTAINQLLLIRNVDTSVTLTQQQIGSLRQVLGTIPSQNLSELQQKQLTVVQDFLRSTPRQQSVSLSSEQTQALSRAIAFVFFTSAAKTAQTGPDIEPSEQVTLTQQQLQQIINGLQAIQQGQLRPNQREETSTLLSDLQQQQETKETVTLSSDQTQQLRTLMGSLTRNETAALEILFLSREAPETINLTQSEINDLITFFQGLPKEEFSTTQRQQQQALINLLTQLQSQAETKIELSSAQTQTFLQNIQGLLFDQSAITETKLSLDQLQDLITYLETAQAELSLSSSKAQSLDRLRRQLASLEANPNNQFVLSPQQSQQLRTFVSSLSGGQRQAIQKALAKEADQDQKKVSSPAISYLNPIGYGNSWGNIGVGLIYNERARLGNSEDGALSLSLGFGDPEQSVGVDTTLNILSLTGGEGDVASDAFSTQSISVEISRNLGDDIGISLGVENLIRYSFSEAGQRGETPTSTYLVGSKRFQLRDDPMAPFGLAYLTVGLGNGRFRSAEDFEFNNDGSQFNLFSSIAVQILPRVNGIAEWTGQDISLGLSVVPFRNLPLVITVAGIDLNGNLEEAFGQEGEARFTGSINYGFFF